MVKDESELASMREACAISDRVYALLAEERLTGRTERDVAWWIERTFRELGADALSFGSIVAAGENGARPHAHPGDAIIEAGTLVTIDMGCVVDGYCSDCTRTFATGPLSAELAETLPPRPAGPARRAGRGEGRRCRPRRRRRLATRDRCGGLRGGVRPRIGPRCRPRGPRGADASPRVRRRARRPETSSPSSRASTCPASAAAGSRIWSSSPTAAARS